MKNKFIKSFSVLQIFLAGWKKYLKLIKKRFDID